MEAVVLLLQRYSLLNTAFSRISYTLQRHIHLSIFISAVEQKSET